MTTKSKIIISILVIVLIILGFTGYYLYENHTNNKKQDNVELVVTSKSSTDSRRDTTTSQSSTEENKSETLSVKDEGQTAEGNTWTEWDMSKIADTDDESKKPQLNENTVEAVSIPVEHNVVVDIEDQSTVKRYLTYNKADDATFEDLKNQLVEAHNQMKTAYHANANKTTASVGDTPLKQAVNQVLKDYFTSNDTYFADYYVAMSGILKFDLNINTTTIKVVKTDTSNVLAFESFLSTGDGLNVLYITGYYNTTLRSFTVTNTLITRDGAVILNNSY